MSHLVGQKAPEFTVQGVSASGDIKSYSLAEFKGKHVVLFFYPLDFTFVCPLELFEMSKLAGEFEQENAVVLGVSIDSEHTHAAWRNTAVSDGGVGALNFPLLADIDRHMMTAYGVANTSPNVALRATIIIDPEGMVRIQQLNDLPVGRNPSEILRLVKSLAFHDEHGDVCPPSWEPGAKSLSPTKESLLAYQAEAH
ncbi:peroxiredoxin [Candidatus Synchoanobacter obligatus]|uniref:Thioredoxin peroxidase n=1 Tax=Candidatus Synchoanobacter obligatus TaxID=2919597 RepID=A0ABT1L541_9GAMM|nr:peroxiredoxin [Candidatus Synchoanobacter obligatus]MCP8352297.1 peroxiredoxin [Candidatus Synchoanobacter obligatus]